MNLLPGMKKSAVPVVAMTAMASAQPVFAQGARVASVAAVQRIVEKKEGAGAWAKAGTGTALPVDSRLRTGKRSKVDVRFTDGSLLRLGQLSSVEFSTAKGVTLAGGQVLYAALKPGRVLAGSATAEIKGSVALIRLNKDNSMDAELFIGLTDVVTPKGTIQLKPGQGVTAFADGTFSKIRVASPRAYGHDGSLSELLEGPAVGPFTGSLAQIPVRTAPERVALQTYQGVLRGPDGTIDFADPTQLNSDRGPFSPFGPFPPALPTLPTFPGTLPTIPGGTTGLTGTGGTGRLGGLGLTGRMVPAAVPRASVGVAAGSMARATTRISPSAASLSTTRRFAVDQPLYAPRGVAFDGSLLDRPEFPLANTVYDRPEAAPYRLAQAPAAPANAGAAETTRAVDTASDVAASDKESIDTAAALKHINEIDRAQGQVSGVDAALLSVLGDGGTALYGGQLHGFYGSGKYLVDVSAQPLRLRRTNSPTMDYSAFNSANVRYRDSWGEIQAGRQRFVAGPTQATLFGSLVRQGAREVMDAVRVSPRLGKGVNFEAAYLVDAYPRNLPYRIAGRQGGYYVRGAVERTFGNFGLNVLKYNGLQTSTGATVDFVLPVVRNEVEFYGEAGRDVFRRRLTTVGLAFPGIFDSAGVDLAVEYADVGSSSLAVAPPKELAVRAYKRVGNNIDILATLSRFSGAFRDTSLVVGVSVGARLAGNGNRYSQ